MLPKEKTINSSLSYRGQVFNVRVETVERSDGVRLTREVVEHGEVVAIVPVDGDDNVLFVRQERTPVGKATLEIPAGRIEEGESSAEAAQRELQEEAGVRAGRLERLLGFYVSPGHCSELVHLFLATELAADSREGDEDEAIEVVKIPLIEAVDLARSGGIEDGKSIVGLLLVSERQ